MGINNNLKSPVHMKVFAAGILALIGVNAVNVPEGSYASESVGFYEKYGSGEAADLPVSDEPATVAEVVKKDMSDMRRSDRIRSRRHRHRHQHKGVRRPRRPRRPLVKVDSDLSCVEEVQQLQDIADTIAYLVTDAAILARTEGEQILDVVEDAQD